MIEPETKRQIRENLIEKKYSEDQIHGILRFLDEQSTRFSPPHGLIHNSNLIDCFTFTSTPDNTNKLLVAYIHGYNAALYKATLLGWAQNLSETIDSSDLAEILDDSELEIKILFDSWNGILEELPSRLKELIEENKDEPAFKIILDSHKKHLEQISRLQLKMEG